MKALMLLLNSNKQGLKVHQKTKPYLRILHHKKLRQVVSRCDKIISFADSENATSFQPYKK